MEESGSGRSFSDFACYRLLRALPTLPQFYYILFHLFICSLFLFLFFLTIFIYSIGSSNKQGNMSLPVAIFCLTVINNGCVFEWLTRLNFPVEQEKEFVWFYPIRKALRRTVSKTFQTAVSIVILRGKIKG